MSFNPADLFKWIEAIKVLIELLKILFPGDQETQAKVAKMALLGGTEA